MRHSPHLALAIVLTFLALGGAPVKADDWRDKLTHPATEFAQTPFWFWNDEITDAETRRQLAAFREKGVYGVVIHARMGLPRTIPYMGTEWLARVRFCVEEAARTDMHVCLYDEGMYPSGSAHGEVVQSNPAFAAQCLVCRTKDVSGPSTVQAPKPRRARFVASVLVRKPGEKAPLALSETHVARAPGETLHVPDGTWQLMTFTQEPSMGHIRGVHWGEDDGQPGAPPAADSARLRGHAGLHPVRL